jgi:hypothetical protein
MYLNFRSGRPQEYIPFFDRLIYDKQKEQNVEFCTRRVSENEQAPGK